MKKDTVMQQAENFLRKADDMVWGPWLLVFLLGTGIYLMIRMRFLPIRNLGYAIKCAFGGGRKKEEPPPPNKKSEDHDHSHDHGHGEISPFSSLMTELAATIGTGNIVGVATAMVLGGPGALVWMVLSSFIGLSTKFAESMLAVKYRVKNDRRENAGGPMYTLREAFPYKKAGKMLGTLFAFFAVCASLGMGNMTQANSIAEAMETGFGINRGLTGLVITIAAILVVLGGIRMISGLTGIMVPVMAVFYLLGTLTIIVTHIKALPGSLNLIFSSAFRFESIPGGIGGYLASEGIRSLRWGVSRGVFSNEAGLGAAGITAAAADTDDPVRQGYISMTGVFFDTAVICSMTGLAIAVSGVLQSSETAALNGTALTIAAFETTFGKTGAAVVSIGITFFAFATIIGWAYQGERAFEFLTGRGKYNTFYRFFYGFAAFAGAVCSLDAVWDFSDICNGLMAIPNLICILFLSEEAVRAIRRG